MTPYARRQKDRRRNQRQWRDYVNTRFDMCEDHAGDEFIPYLLAKLKSRSFRTAFDRVLQEEGEDDEPDLDSRESTVDEVLDADERDGIKR